MEDGFSSAAMVEALPTRFTGRTISFTPLQNQAARASAFQRCPATVRPLHAWTQLVTKASEGDVLIALSGSGNSPNIIRALEMARQIKMKTFALLGYTGGACKELADVVIHFAVHDMQLAEDLQLIVGHMILQMLQKARASGKI
jgi:D-arabinose 5-phosphate isomerase GutQ